MSKPFNLKRASTILAISAAFYLLFCIGAYWFVQQNRAPVQWGTAFYFWVIFYPVLFTLEIFVYRWLHQRPIAKKYANIHIFSVFFNGVMSPLLLMAFPLLVSTMETPATIAAYVHPITLAVVLLNFLLLITGQVCFLLLVRNRNRYQPGPAVEDKDNSHDQLEEFAE